LLELSFELFLETFKAKQETWYESQPFLTKKLFLDRGERSINFITIGYSAVDVETASEAWVDLGLSLLLHVHRE